MRRPCVQDVLNAEKTMEIGEKNNIKDRKKEFNKTAKGMRSEKHQREQGTQVKVR